MKRAQQCLHRTSNVLIRVNISRTVLGRFAPAMLLDNASSTKKRLLFLRRTTAFGGSEITILDLLKAIDYQTTSVSLASSVDVFSNLLTELQLPVKCLPLTAPFTGGFVRMFTSWIRYLIRLRPDKIILAEGGFRDFPLSAALAAFAVARGNVWMMELHPAPEPTPENTKARWGFIPLRQRERARVWFTRGVLSISHGVKDRLVRHYGYAPEKITVIYNGADTRRFSPVSQETRRFLRTKLHIPDEATVLVSTARLDQIKRLDRLIEAFGVLSLEYRDLWLLLTGDGPLRDDLRSLAQSVNNCKYIRFLGHVEDVCAVLGASDIYVLPSDEEGLGLALVEAMASSLVCVATKTVGPSEIIEDGLDGFLTELTCDGVLEGLDQALRLSYKERAEIGNRARQRVLENFRLEQFVARGLAFMQIDSDVRTDAMRCVSSNN